MKGELTAGEWGEILTADLSTTTDSKTIVAINKDPEVRYRNTVRKLSSLTNRHAGPHLPGRGYRPCLGPVRVSPSASREDQEVSRSIVGMIYDSVYR